MKNLATLVIAASLIFSINTAQAKTSPTLYTLKGDAQAGTLIPSVEATSTVPFNKRYNALTSEQQNLVKAKFDELGANDTPPYPLSGLAAVYRPVIKANKIYGDNSTLSITAKVNSSGKVSNIEVHNSDNQKMVAYIERKLQHTKFEAAKCNGVECEMNTNNKLL